jgi:hypothetical protein
VEPEEVINAPVHFAALLFVPNMVRLPIATGATSSTTQLKNERYFFAFLKGCNGSSPKMGL